MGEMASVVGDVQETTLDAEDVRVDQLRLGVKL